MAVGTIFDEHHASNSLVDYGTAILSLALTVANHQYTMILPERISEVAATTEG